MQGYHAFLVEAGGFSAQADGTTTDPTCPQLGGGLCGEPRCAPGCSLGRL